MVSDVVPGKKLCDGEKQKVYYKVQKTFRAMLMLMSLTIDSDHLVCYHINNVDDDEVDNKDDHSHNVANEDDYRYHLVCSHMVIVLRMKLTLKMISTMNMIVRRITQSAAI